MGILQFLAGIFKLGKFMRMVPQPVMLGFVNGLAIVIGLSQLSRAVESRSDRRPQLSDLRESGAIEQDADLVIFLYRPWVYTQEDDDRGKAEIIVAKQRNGPTGIIEATFIDRFARFENMSAFVEMEAESQF